MPFKIGLAQKRKSLLEEELNRIIAGIKERGVEKVFLFGSLASDKVHRSSDLDIIVVQKTAKSFLDRLDEFYQYLNPRLGIDILVYTPEEFEEMKKTNQFIKSAIKNGRVIYER